LAAAATTASAQGYPVRPVRILVPFAAGGVADITARVSLKKLGEAWGSNSSSKPPERRGDRCLRSGRQGGAGRLYLLFITNGNAVSASLFKSLPYDTLSDFAPISTVGFFELVMVVNSDSKIGSVDELIALARANPNKLNIGTINIGSTQNLAAELFKSMSGIDAQVVRSGRPQR